MKTPERAQQILDSLNGYEGSRFFAPVKELCEAVINDARPCDAKIHHGPGHQSTSPCIRKGDHDVHENFLGHEWTGAEAMTGFDESPYEGEG